VTDRRAPARPVAFCRPGWPHEGKESRKYRGRVNFEIGFPSRSSVPWSAPIVEMGL
jgi:hypothetical protein